MKKVLIVSSLALCVGGFWLVWRKLPKARITVNFDGTGAVQLGAKHATFGKGEGVDVQTWNGYHLSASATSWTLTHYGQLLSKGTINPGVSGNMGDTYIDISVQTVNTPTLAMTVAQMPTSKSPTATDLLKPPAQAV